MPAEIEPVVILRRSDRLVVVDKPSGRLVHRTALSRGPREPFVLQSVAAAVGRPVHAVHRLDRGTSGALLMALDAEAARLAQQALGEPTTRKEYLVLVRGDAADAFESDRPLRGEDGTPRPCHTAFRCIARQPEVGPDGVSLLVATLGTGRRHQIRRHLNHLGHHVVGDTTHGKGHVNRAIRAAHGCHRLFLHARSLAFDDPFGGSRWHVASPVPPDLQRVLESIGMGPGVGEAAGQGA